MTDPSARSKEHPMDDTMDMKFQDIMEFVAEERASSSERGTAPMIQFDDDQKLPARIKVIGVGGCGGNAVSTMVLAGIQGVEFIAANTDRQALDGTGAPSKFQIGTKLTHGRGAGANPEVGRNAALEDADRIKALLEGTEMVFITAGMGGGTGTGAAPVIAKIAREVGALAVAVVTKPFSFEGARRMRYAEEGLTELKKAVDALIVIPNDRLINLSEKNTRIGEAFKLSDDVLMQAVKGISDVVLVRGRVNVDFADVKTVMANRGRAVMGMGIAKGPGRGVEAAHKAISSPLAGGRLHQGRTRGADQHHRRQRPGHERDRRGDGGHQGRGGPGGEHHLRDGGQCRYERRDHGDGARHGLRRRRRPQPRRTAGEPQGVPKDRGKAASEAEAGAVE